MATSAQSITAQPQPVSDRWTPYNIFVLVTCILAWSFDIYEQTILQLVTPLLIQEWQIPPVTIGVITTVARWVGLIGIFLFPVLADLYGRRLMLMATVLGYSLLTGFTGFVQNWQQLMVATALTRIPLSGEQPVGTIMVAETAPTKWRATALGGMVGGYPFGYMLTSLAGLVVVPLWGWRALYWLGILPALLVFFIRLGIRESPRFERVTAEMLKEGLKRQLDILAPMRHYPREMVIGILLYFFYLFTWIGWSAWMPQFLANEKGLGFQTTATYLSIWMFFAIFAYWLCGALSDKFGRRFAIPLFVIPASVLLVVLGGQGDPTSLFIIGGIANFLITGSFGSGIGYISELFPTVIRGTAYGSVALIGGIGAALAPTIVGAIATAHSIAAALPLLALTFFLIAPVFLFVARETTRQELTDFIGQR
ncbi:MAG TPA: MFS transporter [Chloroflexota bacterium]|nr:MFS transporter [Chloroflexota bacterium]HZU06871.1 MFS transporter [Chloroflexota bacterium]